jgi:hypothetical protein
MLLCGQGAGRGQQPRGGARGAGAHHLRQEATALEVDAHMHDDAAWLEGRDGEEAGVEVRGCSRQDGQARQLPLDRPPPHLPPAPALQHATFVGSARGQRS